MKQLLGHNSIVYISWLLIITGVFGIGSLGFDVNNTVSYLAVCLIVSGGVLQWQYFRGFKRAYRSMKLALLNLQDGEFSSRPIDGRNEQWSEVLEQINKTSESLHQQKQKMYHRELLFDRVMDQSPIAILLVNHRHQLIYHNRSAQKSLLTSDVTINMPLADALQKPFEGLMVSADMHSEQLLDILSNDGTAQMWHLSSQRIKLGDMPHRLMLLQNMNEQFNRREVAALKRSIRVLNHELNNSLAPLSSLCHSGTKLLASDEKEKLMRIFNTFANRIERLQTFIMNYSKFARLSLPNKKVFQWRDLLEDVAQLTSISLDIDGVAGRFNGDKSQLEQVLINLIKNAQEAGSELSDICLSYRQYLSDDNNYDKNYDILEVCDRGHGLSTETLENACLPFYSTKSSGTGVGLALCREIIQHHGGNLSIQNRDGGGAIVRVCFMEGGNHNSFS